jgi:nucleoside-diphosphate-sugar epimerase
MKYLVTGATGFTGSHTLPKLIKKFGPAVCFVRATSNHSALPIKDITFIEGDFDTPNTFKKALDGIDTLVNIASIGCGHAEMIVNACQATGVKRVLFIGSTAMFTQLNAKTKSIKKKAETYIENSGLDYTILRPTMIYGTPKDRNIWRLIQAIKKLPVFPVFGTGTFLQQPIHVDDLATAIVQALSSEKSIDKAYNLSGKAPLSYNQIIETIGKALDKKPTLLHLPIWLSIALAGISRCIPFMPNLKTEQIYRLNEDKSFSHKQALDDFDFTPRTFENGIKEAIQLITNDEFKF